MNWKVQVKILIIIFAALGVAGCQTTVSEYNKPKSFTKDTNAVELWMNDDGVNSAVILSINGQEAWQRKALQGSAMSVLVPNGANQVVIRMVYQKFMEFPFEQVLNIEPNFESGFKYVFVSKYNRDTKTFSYRFEKISKNAVCAYDPTNFKRIITGQLTCSNAGTVYEFT